MFQSSPTSKGGRYDCVNASSARHSLVSILAHLEGWALRLRVHDRVITYWFQSSPTSKGGRYDVRAPCTDVCRKVSILAHLEGWALRAGPRSTDR